MASLKKWAGVEQSWRRTVVGCVKPSGYQGEGVPWYGALCVVRDEVTGEGVRWDTKPQGRK